MIIDAKVLQISKNFKLSEFLVTNTGLKNIPTWSQIKAIERLVINQLQPFRDYVGKSIVVTSGIRVEAVNAAVGGAKQSQHPKGEAADWNIPSMTPKEAMKAFLASGVPYDQVILELKFDTWWIHSSYKEDGNRSEALLATYNQLTGKMDYTAWIS